MATAFTSARNYIDDPFWTPILPTDSSSAVKTLVNEKDSHAERIQIFDTRRQIISQDLVRGIIEGLKSAERESPPLLLWNEPGLSLFDAVIGSPDYYPARREWLLLHDSIQEIVATIANGDRVIELGAGNMKKTAFFLQALQAQGKYVEYYACDVDQESLRKSLLELQCVLSSASSTIKLHGLLGTYEDCAAWLKGHESSSHTYVFWLGNSIANFTPSEAAEYTRAFLSNTVSMIVGLDGSQDQREIALSYEGPSNREFVLQGLTHANQLLNTEVFNLDDWGFAGSWNPAVWMHESYYIAYKDLSISVYGEIYEFKRGDKLRSIRSGKWPQGKAIEICEEAGGILTKAWMNQEKSYGVYLFEKHRS
ncbi:unnamed protein product [Clonostachys rhizophaga]|uniref:Histidine-specific methyltransferase SAM-dependent domain-containing protein n=1 Tax=Clonostachys rhizophaga TaxID=160324 RepID=A0A9N9VFI6_9HYPO|nr:unnamed protein product [Clonostachys rhizophaga]